ncbi:MAG TPA: S8 family serine peptidase, partial [Acidimicrobiales bacterium]|nr:S8 family serine peptidase [Acidimicrobiales bacterium]
MAQATTIEQYVLLPPQGLRARGRVATAGVQAFLRSVEAGAQELSTAAHRPVRFRVVDSLGPDGAKLIEATAGDALALRALQPTMRLAPVVHYQPAVAPRAQVRAPVVAPASRAITVRVVSATDGTPVAGAIVVALTSVAAGTGAQAITDAQGQVELPLGSSAVLERLYIYPNSTFWSLRKDGLTLSDGAQVGLRPLDLGSTDCLRYHYPHVDDDAGGGVTVGVVDTGVAGHPDLVIDGGANTAAGEDPDDFGDNGAGHGTHVAGIIAARGAPPTGIRGVAPGVRLRSYRVFAEGSNGASNFAVIKAVDQAVADRCDLVNMSLGGAAFDPVLKAAVEDARAGGSVCICAAAGNDGRAPVAYPAADEMAVAVSALGRIGTFPDDAAEVDTVAAPYGSDQADFIGAFSNVGPQMDLTAPGVAIISTVPGSYAETSGT